MNPTLLKVFNWAVNSTQFKKWSGILGGFCFGMWVSRNYWQQINATLDVWEISKDTFMQVLLIIAGLAGVGGSIALSAVKSARVKKNSQTLPET